jgi:hypothetical protein
MVLCNAEFFCFAGSVSDERVYVTTADKTRTNEVICLSILCNELKVGLIRIVCFALWIMNILCATDSIASLISSV